MTFVNRKIFDENGNPILSIKYVDEIYPFKYKKPTITYNSLYKETEMKPPQIKIIANIRDIEKLGFNIVSIPISKDMAWSYRQRAMYVLRRKGTVADAMEKKLNSVPHGDNDRHNIEFDEANLLIRLVGPKAGPQGFGDWLEMER